MADVENNQWLPSREELCNPIKLIEAPLRAIDLERAACWAFLSPEESIRANRYRSGIRRHTFVAGRAALRATLSTHLNVPADSIALNCGRQGKPYLQPTEGRCVAHFNISHSPSRLIIGIAQDHGIGVDVEDFHQRLNVEALVRNSFSNSECDEWLQYPVLQREAAFLRGWTRKEAAWKLFGCETQMAWNDIAVSLDANSRTVIHARSASGQIQLLDCFSWHSTPHSIASAVVPRVPGIRPRFEIQAFDFGRASELVWNSQT